MSCCNLQGVPLQTLFLGCSITDFSASVGWNSSQSEISVVVVEDQCIGYRKYYTTCLTPVSGNFADIGFLGENRYTRPDGSMYSACYPESNDDALVRSSINLVGAPAYFRYGDFEFAGIISDWTRTNSNGVPTYRIKIVDPRLILEGVQLIIGDYNGSVAGTVSSGLGGTGEPQPNIFNVYGYLEQFGLVCPSYSQCSAGTYSPSTSCPTAVDGPVFGSLVGGYGGSRLNNNGMPYNRIITGFNFLANSVPVLTNAWSPYGRVSFFSNDLTSIGSSGCGLITPDNGGSYFNNKNYYYVDLSELPAFPDDSYRIAGTSISLLDLINRAAGDLNFDFYFELLPTKDPSNIFSSNCVAKIIKLRVVNRNNQPSLDKICEFIQSADCILESSIGQELRNETVSKFIIGGRKKSIYQVEQNTDPDGGGPSGLISLDSYSGGIRFEAGTESIDNVILPYFGLDYDGNFIVPYTVSGYWQFDAPVWSIQSELQAISFGSPTIRINENEIRAALKGYVDWESYAAFYDTDTWQTIYRATEDKPMIDLSNIGTALSNNLTPLAIDAASPHHSKQKASVTPLYHRKQSDKEAIYNWVRSYGDYYGKKFAVRVPFTCVVVDNDSLQPIISEQPTDGGWTEVSGVLGLPNGGPLSAGVYETLNFFRDDENKIGAFVKFNNAVLKTVKNLPRESYLYYYKIFSGTYDSANGPPTGTPTSSILYRDNLTESLYVYYFDQWLPINQSPILHDSGVPDTGIFNKRDFAPLYYDVDSQTVYVAGDSSYLSSTGVNVNDWDIILESYLYVKAQVEPEYVYHDKRSYFAPRAVVNIPDSIALTTTRPSYIEGLRQALNVISGAVAGDEGILSVGLTVGGDAAFMGLEDRAVIIDSAAVPLEHTTHTYGPWYNPTVVGRTEIIQDPDLVPWRYNGYTAMNLAATNLANEARVNMYRGELGSITIPGYPTIPLGAELNALNAGYYASNEHLVENRTLSSGSISGLDYGGNLISKSYARTIFSSTWGGSYGPNVTDISVSVRPDGFSTTYNMRTFAPRRGFFERYRAQRIEMMSVRANKIANLLREEEAARERKLLFQSLSKGRHAETHLGNEQGANPSVIMGEEIANPSGVTKRTSVASTSPLRMSRQLRPRNFSDVHSVSMDGIFRPIMASGPSSAGETSYIFYTSGNRYTHVLSEQPGGGYAIPHSNYQISARDLNPFSNPSGSGNYLSYLAAYRTDSTSVGHDLQMPGLNGNNSLAIQAAKNYSDSYKSMGLRGPVLIKGWGYDVYGHPIPNKNFDPNTPNLQTASGLHSQKFLSGVLQRPDTWASGPVDMRFDRGRGVWVDGNQTVAMQVCSGNISKNSVGYARLIVSNDATRASGSFAVEPSGTLFQLYNFGQTVWDQCVVLARPVYFYGAEAKAKSPIYCIEKAWSATRVFGKLLSSVSANSTGTVGNPSGLNGPYYPRGDTLTVSILTNNVTVPAGAMVYAELVNIQGSGNDIWVVYASDCSGVL